MALTDQLSSMWDNVLSLVMKGVDFELLPMIPESQELSSPLAVNLDQPDGPTYDTGSSEGSLTREPPQYLFGTHMNGEAIHSSNGKSFSFPNGTFSTDTKASILSPSTARTPPPPPPPGPPLPREDSFTVAMQSISRLIMQIEGVCDSRELKSIDVSRESEAGSVLLDYDKLDKAGKKWADFHAFARDGEVKDGRGFIELANRKRKEIHQQLKKLDSKSDKEEFTLKELELAVEILGTAGDWYQGGVKDLKPEGRGSLYERLEKLIEAMVEFVKLRGEILELPQQHHYEGELQDVLDKTLHEFKSKDTRLGVVITTREQIIDTGPGKPHLKVTVGPKTREWEEHRFPVCNKLAQKLRGYLCGLVIKFVEGSLEAVRKVDTYKNRRNTTEAKERLEESVQLLQTAVPYFSAKQFASSEEICICEACRGAENGTSLQNGHQTFLQDDLLKLTVRVAETYFQLGINQFEGYINKMGKQDICDHFQSILHLLKNVEELINSLPRDETDNGTQTAAGVITRLPESEGLKETMSKSCHSLCTHLEKEATVYKELPSERYSDTKKEKTKKMVQWLAFYCKYSYQISTASGSSLADHEISTHKIVQFATSFIEDNLKQYDQFVHILDEKRIKAHFERIMRVVHSLVSNLPATSSGKHLKELPNSGKLVKMMVESCDRLVEHYREHEKSIVKRLQVAEVEPDALKRRKEFEEVTKWLSFGGEYLREVLTVLGPDHMTNVMRSFSQFEKVASGLTDILRNHY